MLNNQGRTEPPPPVPGSELGGLQDRAAGGWPLLVPSRTIVVSRPRWPSSASGPSHSDFILINNARRDAPPLVDRDALLPCPCPDGTAVMTA